MRRSDVESFLRTLLLGDFEENQNSAALVVGGLIGLIPILDQVLDARDITGTLYKINQSGGFKNASTDQIVNFGFATFGTIPEVGSVFKGVFKPLYKQRRAAKGAVHGGLHAVEAMLGMRKGGAITWIRKELIGKWGARTQGAIATANAALASTIEFTEFLATASGWKDWLIPDPIQELAKQSLPGLRGLRGKLSAPIQRASDEIREFLEDLLGEQAASVVMQVGRMAAQGSALPGSRTRTGHNAAASQRRGQIPPRQPAAKVKGRAQANGQRGAGPVHVAAQVTRRQIESLAAREKGLIGEHMVDYYELKRLGGTWPHDKPNGAWKPDDVKKLNVDKRPVNLHPRDLGKVTQPGIDTVWEHGEKITVTEAKASANKYSATNLGKAKERRGSIPTLPELGADLLLLHYLLTDSSDKQGTQSPLMQMSKAWVRDRAPGEGLQVAIVAKLQNLKCARRVVFVTLESAGALEHVEALADIHLGKAEKDVRLHENHGTTEIWEARDIDKVDEARKAAHKAKAANPANKPAKPKKPPKGKK